MASDKVSSEIYLHSGRLTRAADATDAFLPQEMITETKCGNDAQGADVRLKMSMFAKVDGQSCSGAVGSRLRVICLVL